MNEDESRGVKVKLRHRVGRLIHRLVHFIGRHPGGVKSFPDCERCDDNNEKWGWP